MNKKKKKNNNKKNKNKVLLILKRIVRECLLELKEDQKGASDALKGTSEEEASEEKLGSNRAVAETSADSPEKSEETLNDTLEVKKESSEEESVPSAVAEPTPPSYTPNIEWKIIKQGGNYTVCDQENEDVKENYLYTVTDSAQYGGEVVSFQGTTVNTDKLSITSCPGVSVLKLPKTVNTSSENAKTEVVIDATDANAPKGLRQITVAEDSKINTMEIQGRCGKKLTIFPNFLPEDGVLKLTNCQFNTLDIRDIAKMQFSIKMDAATYNSLKEKNGDVLGALQVAGKLGLQPTDNKKQSTVETETKLQASVPAPDFSVSVVDIGAGIEKDKGIRQFIINSRQRY